MSRSPDRINPDEMLKDEHERLRQRRSQAKLEEGNPAGDAVGIALSGGGIRSATFNLGLLQAFERFGLMRYADYLSTVSGGGYIGASLTWFCSKLGLPFPFGKSRADHATGGKFLEWLRAHGSYLTPGDGLNLWALIAAALTGILVNLLILVPVFLLIVYFLSHEVSFSSLCGANGFDCSLHAGLLLLGAFVLYAIAVAFGTGLDMARGFIVERRKSQYLGWLLMAGVLLAVVGTLPLVYDYLACHIPDWRGTIMSSISLSGIAAVLGALRGRSRGNEAKGARSIVLSGGLTLLIYGIFLWFYHLMHDYDFIPGWLWFAFALSLALAIIANVNRVSMHRYYRNRLMEAYLPYPLVEKKQQEADQCLLKDIPQTAAPYHIINTNVQLVGSENARLRGRGGDSFIFSPLYCGSESTAYLKTSEYVGGSMNLATAFAISGAAVDPNTYATRSRPLTFLMSLFNVRLGYWIDNPGRGPGRAGLFSHPLWYISLFSEMFGRGMDERSRHIHLSDGGHFENLGLYELIRRRCRHIIVSDAGADPNWNFDDLARAIELVRLDFGARVKLDTSQLFPQGKNRISPTAFVRGTVTYADNQTADLLYITTAMIEGLPEDIYGFRRANPSFPDQPTLDQFFDEPQFEAYRELGFQIGRLVCGEKADITKVFTHPD